MELKSATAYSYREDDCANNCVVIHEKTGSKDNKRSVSVCVRVQNNDLATGACESKKGGAGGTRYFKREKRGLIMSWLFFFDGMVFTTALSHYQFPPFITLGLVYQRIYTSSSSKIFCFHFCKSSNFKHKNHLTFSPVLIWLAAVRLAFSSWWKFPHHYTLVY